MVRRTTDELAFLLWQERGCPLWDQQRDHYRATLIEGQYRYYLAYEAEHNTENAIDRLTQSVQGSGIFLLAVLDGSTERMEAVFRSVFLASKFNGAIPSPALVADKENNFVRMCHNAWSEASERSSRYSDETFQYRDSCLSVFSEIEKGSLFVALSSAVRLNGTLSNFNQTHGLPWQDQVHARISIAETINLAVRNLYFANRGNLILSPSFLPLLDASELTLLRATGLRSGAPRNAREGLIERTRTDRKPAIQPTVPPVVLLT